MRKTITKLVSVLTLFAWITGYWIMGRSGAALHSLLIIALIVYLNAVISCEPAEQTP